MYRGCLMIFTLLLFIAMLTGCGDVEPITPPPPPEVAEINWLLKDRWKRGYESEDVELYMSSFWKEGYYYWSDYATDDNIEDDVEFDDWDQEKESAIRVFRKFRNIELEFSEPPEVLILDEEKTVAEVRNHYKIQFFAAEGGSLPGGYEAAYAEGDNVFLFEFKKADGAAKEEWRITEWRQYEYNEEEINSAWSAQ